MKLFKFSLLSKFLMLALVACSSLPRPQEQNLLKIYDNEQIHLNGLVTQIFPVDLANTNRPIAIPVSSSKMTTYVVTLVEKDGQKTLIVAPLEKYTDIDFKPYRIIRTRFFQIAKEEAGTMMFLTNSTAASEKALPIFYR